MPYVRADWFVFQASTPPLYHDILRLPSTIRELEAQNGVDLERDFLEEHSFFRAGMSVSGVSNHNRIIERHDSVNGAYWRSYDFRSSEGEDNILKNPLTFKAACGEIIFNLPNGLQAYLLANAEGKRLDGPADTAIVRDLSGGIEVQGTNGRSCMGCHFKGMRDTTDRVRSSVLNVVSFPDHDKVLAVYPIQSDLNDLFKRDDARFKQAILATGGQITSAEPINEVSKNYHQPLTLDLAAAELGLRTSVFRQRIREDQTLGALGFGQLLEQGGAYQRDTFEGNFPELARDLGLGIPADRLLIREEASAKTPVPAAAIAPPIPEQIVVIDPFQSLYGTWIYDDVSKIDLGRCDDEVHDRCLVSISREDQQGSILQIQLDESTSHTAVPYANCRFANGLKTGSQVYRSQWVVRPASSGFRVAATLVSCSGSDCSDFKPGPQGEGTLSVRGNILVLDTPFKSATFLRR